MKPVLPQLPELKQLRAEDCKTFDLGGGRRKLIKTYHPLHYRKDDTWEDIVLLPVDAGQTLELTSAPYTLTISKTEPYIHYRSPGGSTIEISLKELNGVAPLPSQAIVQEGQVTWPNVAPDCDIILDLKTGGVEFFKFLKSPAAPTVIEWEMIESLKGGIKTNSRHKGKDNKGRQVLLTKQHHSHETLEDGRDTYRITETVSHKTLKKEKKTRVKTAVNDIEFPLMIDVPDITENISADIDDGGEEGETYWTYLGGGELFAIGMYGYESHGGFRFRTIPIPQGATIDLAVLKMTLPYVYGSPDLKVYGDDTDSAAEWSETNRPSQMAKTTASTAFGGAAMVGQNSVDITAIVQEIVDRGGWASNNNMRFGVFNQSVIDYNFISVYDFPHANAVFLEIDYTEDTPAPEPVVETVIPSPGPAFSGGAMTF